MAKLDTVILLAGGESTRFRPLVDKALFPFFGRPLLAIHYDRFRELGAHKVVVVAHPDNAEAFRACPVPDGLSVSIRVQDGAGQAAAILAAEADVPTGAVLVLNASDMYDVGSLRSFMDAPVGTDFDILLGAVKVRHYFPGGYLTLDWKGNVAGIVEKPAKGSEPSDIVRIVADRFADVSKLYAAIREAAGDPSDRYERAITSMIGAGSVAKPMISLGRWLALKYPWHVLGVMDVLLAELDGQRIAPTAQIAKGVIIEGAVVIEDGVRIFEGTKIVGPCYIGKGTIVGNNNIVRGSHIGAGCVTGFNTDITRSYIGDNCWFHSNYVGDSVLAGNISMGSGTVLANLRLDEGEIKSVVKDESVETGRNKLGSVIGTSVRIGVNVSVMPGVKIGGNSFIGAGITLLEDVPEGSFVRLSPGQYVIAKNAREIAGDREAFKAKL